MPDITEFWPPVSTFIYGTSENEHIAITRFKTSLENTHKSMNMIK
jgi:hypothetical protein